MPRKKKDQTNFNKQKKKNRARKASKACDENLPSVLEKKKNMLKLDRGKEAMEVKYKTLPKTFKVYTKLCFLFEKEPIKYKSVCI